MITGVRQAVLRAMRPVTLHGRAAVDLRFVFLDDDTQQLQSARVSPDVAPPNLQPDDHILVEYRMAEVVRVELLKVGERA
jgi:hypothetical protein